MSSGADGCAICGSTTSDLSRNGKCNNVGQCDRNRASQFPAKIAVPGDLALGTVDHFKRVLNEALGQVMPGGKGEERHGNGAPLREQPWRSIAREVKNGRAFLEGQARKKLTEATHLSDPARYRREMLGAVAYTVFAIMIHDEEQPETTKS